MKATSVSQILKQLRLSNNVKYFETKKSFLDCFKFPLPNYYVVIQHRNT